MEGERVEAGQGHRRLLNEVLSITAQEWGFRHIRTVRAPILNEVLSITAQEWFRACRRRRSIGSSMKS